MEWGTVRKRRSIANFEEMEAVRKTGIDFGGEYDIKKVLAWLLDQSEDMAYFHAKTLTNANIDDPELMNILQTCASLGPDGIHKYLKEQFDRVSKTAFDIEVRDAVSGKPMDFGKCEDCGKPLSAKDYFLNPQDLKVCGDCIRKRHKDVTNPGWRKKKAQEDERELYGEIVSIEPQGSLTLVGISDDRGNVEHFPMESNMGLRALEDAFGSVDAAIGQLVYYGITDYGTIAYIEPEETPMAESSIRKPFDFEKKAQVDYSPFDKGYKPEDVEVVEKSGRYVVFSVGDKITFGEIQNNGNYYPLRDFDDAESAKSYMKSIARRSGLKKKAQDHGEAMHPETRKIVNEEDADLYDHYYEVEVGTGTAWSTFWGVYADNETEALDIIGEYLSENAPGLLIDEEYANELMEEGEEIYDEMVYMTGQGQMLPAQELFIHEKPKPGTTKEAQTRDEDAWKYTAIRNAGSELHRLGEIGMGKQEEDRDPFLFLHYYTKDEIFRLALKTAQEVIDVIKKNKTPW